MDTIEIRGESIKLGQLLKLHGVPEHGAMAKDLIADGEVTVNGEVETRRGATIRPGDRVETLGEAIEVATEEPSPVQPSARLRPPVRLRYDRLEGEPAGPPSSLPAFADLCASAAAVAGSSEAAPTAGRG